MTVSDPASASTPEPAAPTEGGAVPTEMNLGSKRAAITTLDQGISSASNFAVGVVVARVSGVEGLGGFALAYAAWLLIAALHRALITDPMAITGDGRRSRSSVRELQEGLAAEMVLGAIAGTAVAALGIILLLAGQRSFGLSQLVLAPWIPALLAQDYWRWIGFMHANPKASLTNDLVFDLVQAVTFGALLASRIHSGLLAIAAWGFSALAGAVFGLWQFKVRPKFRGGFASLKRKFQVGGWIGAGAIAGWGVSQMYSVITAITLGPVGLGGLRAAQNLVGGPSFVLIQAGGSVGLPEAAKAYEESGWMGLKRVSRIVTAAGLVSVGLVLVGTVFFGGAVLRLLYGPSFGRFSHVAVVFALIYTVAVLSLGDILELKATKRTRPLFDVQAVALVASIIGVAVLSVAFGVVGAAIGFGVGTTVLTGGQVRAGRRLGPRARNADGVDPERGPVVLIAMLQEGVGKAAVEAHVSAVRSCLEAEGAPVELVTPLSTMRRLGGAVLLPARVLAPVFPRCAAAWSRRSRYWLLRVSVGLRLARLGPTVVYAQGPLAARGALRAVRDRSQKVVLGVYLSGSRPTGWVDREPVRERRARYRRASRAEESVILEVDGLVYVGDTAHPPDRDGADVADLVTVGSLEVLHGYRFLLEVLRQAAGMGYRYTLDIVGSGTLWRQIPGWAEALGVAEQVRLLGGQADLSASLCGHKAYVRASYCETGPLAVAAAMSAGLPVFALPAGIIPEVLSDGRCGVEWPTDDPYTAACWLIRVLEDPRLRADMTEACRRRFPGRFAGPRLAPRLVEFFRAVAGEDRDTIQGPQCDGDTSEGTAARPLTVLTADGGMGYGGEYS